MTTSFFFFFFPSAAVSLRSQQRYCVSRNPFNAEHLYDTSNRCAVATWRFVFSFGICCWTENIFVWKTVPNELAQRCWLAKVWLKIDIPSASGPCSRFVCLFDGPEQWITWLLRVTMERVPSTKCPRICGRIARAFVCVCAYLCSELFLCRICLHVRWFPFRAFHVNQKIACCLQLFCVYVNYIYSNDNEQMRTLIDVRITRRPRLDRHCTYIFISKWFLDGAHVCLP